MMYFYPECFSFAVRAETLVQTSQMRVSELQTPYFSPTADVNMIEKETQVATHGDEKSLSLSCSLPLLFRGIKETITEWLLQFLYLCTHTHSQTQTVLSQLCVTVASLASLCFCVIDAF